MYSPVPVEVQTKSSVSTCYRPDYFLEHTCREPIGFTGLYQESCYILLQVLAPVTGAEQTCTVCTGLYRRGPVKNI